MGLVGPLIWHLIVITSSFFQWKYIGRRDYQLDRKHRRRLGVMPSIHPCSRMVLPRIRSVGLVYTQLPPRRFPNQALSSFWVWASLASQPRDVKCSHGSYCDGAALLKPVYLPGNRCAGPVVKPTGFHAAAGIPATQVIASFQVQSSVYKKRPPRWPLVNRSSGYALAEVSSFAAYQINKPNAILLSTSARL